MIDRIGHYDLIERVGSGSQGTVYKAFDASLDRIVAVKVFDRLSGISKRDFQTISEEARLAAKLNHPNISTVYEFQIVDEIAYMVMEYVPNSLHAYIQEEGRLDNDHALQLSIEICSAVSTAHNAGIVHGDLKPQNILLSDSGSVKLADFGLARAMESTDTTYDSVGTFSYMAPEQWQNNPTDQRTDVYALGVVIYEMLTGRPPFEGSLGELLRAHIELPVPPISSCLGVPLRFEQTIRRALSKDPQDRFQRVSEMVSFLEYSTPSESVQHLTSNDDVYSTVYETDGDDDSGLSWYFTRKLRSFVAIPILIIVGADVFYHAMMVPIMELDLLLGNPILFFLFGFAVLFTVACIPVSVAALPLVYLPKLWGLKRIWGVGKIAIFVVGVAATVLLSSFISIFALSILDNFADPRAALWWAELWGRAT